MKAGTIINRNKAAGLAMFIALLMYANFAFSQAASPYSRYGLGYVRNNVFSANYAMGGLAAPYASAMHINTANPASYASLYQTTIEAGFNVDGLNAQTKDSLYRIVHGTINHIAVAFVPKRDKFAVTFGLLPYTNVNYDFVQNFNDSSIGRYKYAYSGKGSLYQVFAGGAYKIKGRINDVDQFSIGANFGYVFGRLDYQKIITFPDDALSYSTRNVTNMNVNAFNYNAGIQYRRRIFHNKGINEPRTDIYMTLGASASGGVKLNARTSNYWERFELNSASGYLASIDTSNSSINQKSKITMPVNFSAGAMFGNELFWMVGADFKYSSWSQYSSPLNNDQLKDSWRISLGLQMFPKYDDKSKNYFNKVQYRFGGYYGKSQFSYNGKQLSEAGGTIGMGFPFKVVGRVAGALNIGADIGSRSAGNKNAVSENYYKLVFGFVLNDAGWFFKRKFD